MGVQPLLDAVRVEDVTAARYLSHNGMGRESFAAYATRVALVFRVVIVIVIDLDVVEDKFCIGADVRKAVQLLKADAAIDGRCLLASAAHFDLNRHVRVAHELTYDMRIGGDA